MANTNTPAQSTHQQVFQPVMSTDFIIHRQTDPEDPSKFLSSAFTNCYPIVDPVVAGDPKYRVTNIPPLNFGYTGSSNYMKPDTAIMASNGFIYMVSGGGNPAYVSSVDCLNGSNVVTAQATFASNSGMKFFMAEYVVAANNYIMIMASDSGLDASTLYAYSIGFGGALTLVGSLAFTEYCRGLVFLDGYLFTVHANQRILNSSIGNPLVWNTTTEYIDAEMFGDFIVSIDTHHNHLVAFGVNSIEFFYNAAVEIGSPLKRQASYAQRIGLMAYRSGTYIDSMTQTTNINDKLYFMGGNNDSASGFYCLDNFQLKKIDKGFMDYINPWMLNWSRLHPLNLNGRYAVAISFQVATEIRTFAYIIDNGVMIELDLRNQDDEQVVPVLTVITRNLAEAATFMCVGQYSFSAWSRSTYELCHMSFDTYLPDTYFYPVVQVGKWRSNAIDFGNYNNKHIKWVDAIGSLGNATVLLTYYKDMNNRQLPVATESKTQNPEYPLRWRNLGPHRRLVLELTLTPRDYNDNYSLEGINVAYNQHAY